MLPPPATPPAFASRPTIFSYGLLFVLFVLVGTLGLATPLITVFFSYLALNRLHFTRSRWVAVGLFVVLLGGLFYGFVRFIGQAWHELPEIANTVIPALVTFATQLGIELPFEDLESLRGMAVESIQGTLGFLAKIARLATKESVYLLGGVVVAVLVFLNPELDPDRHQHPDSIYSRYADAVVARFGALYRSFRTVIGAQVMISAVNTFATALFVFGTGMRNPLVVLIITFLCGILPVIGNLISNTIITGIALTVSPRYAMAALVFLIVIHKLEYFLNSKIIGSRIRYPMWLTLVALLIGERLLGIAGILLAPVILNFIKMETTKSATVAAVPMPTAAAPTAVPLADTGNPGGDTPRLFARG